MQSIVEVPFYAESVQTVREGESVWVVVKRVCESLGIEHAAQTVKLRAKAWATVSLVETVAEDGSKRELFCLDLDSLPMWLATIEVSRVKPEARFKLVAYQKECARALRDHFYGRAATAPSEFGQVASLLLDLQRQVTELRERPTATITSAESRSLAGRIRRAGALVARFDGGLPKARGQQIRMEVLALAGWSGSGCRYENMPADRYPYAERAISLVERRIHEQHPPPQRQLALLKKN